jgi:hypothetical protein
MIKSESALISLGEACVEESMFDALYKGYSGRLITVTCSLATWR